MKRPRTSAQCNGWWLLAASALVLASCVAPPNPQRVAADAPVFPAPPAAARFRFERTLYGSKDVIGETRNAAILRLVNREDTSAGAALGNPHAVAVDHGRIFVSDPGERQVEVFDFPGRRFYRIGADGAGALQEPQGLSVDRRGRLFVADAGAGVIHVYDTQGRYLRSIGGPQWFGRLTGVTADPDGTRVYAVDGGNNGVGALARARVRVFDAQDGHHLFDFGKRGSGPGEFSMPFDLAVGGAGQLYVTDSGNYRVQIFDHDGKYVGSFGSVGWRPGHFGRPKAIAADAAGNVYVVDAVLGNVQAFDASGAALFSIGGHDEAAGPVRYLLPSGVAIDADGTLYVLDQGYRRIDVFRRVS